MPTRQFQFQTGAIKRRSRTAVSARFEKCFNSKLVRLKGYLIAAIENLHRRCFNSKLVRLKDSLDNSPACYIRRFQFQTGAIKSVAVSLSVSIEKICFNSKLVRLKGFDRLRSFRNRSARFNSKLVRLKGGAGALGRRVPCKFQFQTGAIKRCRWRFL